MRIYAAWKLFIKAANGTAPVRGIATSGSFFYSWNNTFLRNPSYATIDPRFHDSTIRISSISFVTASSNLAHHLRNDAHRNAGGGEKKQKNCSTTSFNSQLLPLNSHDYHTLFTLHFLTPPASSTIPRESKRASNRNNRLSKLSSSYLDEGRKEGRKHLRSPITLFPVVVAGRVACGSDKNVGEGGRVSLSDTGLEKFRRREQRRWFSALSLSPLRSASRGLIRIALGCRSDEPWRAPRESNIDRRSSGLTSSQEGESSRREEGGERSRVAERAREREGGRKRRKS